jgi:hypothetical protein
LSSELLDAVKEEDIEEGKEEETEDTEIEPALDDLDQFVAFANTTEADNSTDDEAASNGTLFDDDNSVLFDDIMYAATTMDPLMFSVLADNATTNDNDTADLYADFLVVTSDNGTDNETSWGEEQEAAEEELFNDKDDNSATSSQSAVLETNVEFPLGRLCVCQCGCCVKCCCKEGAAKR